MLNLFAAYLLMPSWAVKQAFLQRGYEPANCSALQAYIVSGQLGVGYSTLIKHLRSSLGVISPEHASRLLKITPKHIREAILGGDRTRHLVVVDRAWSKVPIDLQVGEMAIVPPKVKLEGKSVGKVGIHELGSIVEGGVPGIARVESNDGSWATFIRVS